MAEAKSTSVERWLPIPGYEGLYEASDSGRVRGVDRIDARGRRWKGKVLSSVTVSTYDMVGLWKDGKQKSMKVHTAVLTAFVGPRPDGMEGCHGDGNSKNNHLSNLRWDTVSENKLDTVRHKTHRWSARTECTRGHELTDDNLSPSDLLRGRRTCLTCMRERAVNRRRARRS